MEHKNKKRYLIITFWGYPFGGGEEFMYQTMEWVRSRMNMSAYWLCFSNGSETYKKFEIKTSENFGVIIKNNNFDKKVIYNWIKLIKPDIVHNQGLFRREIHDICVQLRVEFLSGYHFWTGAVVLNEATRNINIMENIENHRCDEEIKYLVGSKFATLYVASDFVQECIKKVASIDLPIVYPVPGLKCKSNGDSSERIYVTMINIHKLKGGEIFLHLLENIKDAHFMAIKTEPHSEELDERIRISMSNRSNCKFIERVDEIATIYRVTRILLVPSLVDETFCRVANEGMMNGLPIISSGKGFLGSLLKHNGIIISPDDKNQWVEKVSELYNNPELLDKYSKKSLGAYEKYNEEVGFFQFSRIVNTVMNKSKSNNVMIFCPWCDQGLGIQSRNYYNILKESNKKVFIFSYKPYLANSSIELQSDPEEWAIEELYYSPNDREHVTDSEIRYFVERYNIGICLLPETCWNRVFEIAKLLRVLDVKCFAIPNIEIVRGAELFKHRYFHKILCSNKLCEDKFIEYGFKDMIEFIGFTFMSNVEKGIMTKTKPEDKMKFLFVGGLNAYTRKNVLKVCKAFSSAFEKNKNISLTCLIQDVKNIPMDKRELLEKYMGHEAINVIIKKNRYDEVLNYYYSHHVCIHVSRHEGLGLGFYESLSTGTPVITLDCMPHNEIVKDGVSGWVIPCSYEKMEDNNDSLMSSARFEIDDLANKILEVSSDKNNKVFYSAKRYFDDYLSEDIFRNRLLKSLEF